MTKIYRITSDNHSNHNLPVGAEVFQVPAPEWADTPYFYTQDNIESACAVDDRDMEYVGDDDDTYTSGEQYYADYLNSDSNIAYLNR